MKFRITDKVSSFLHEGKRYFPGDVVDLPPRYASLNWLEPVKKPKAAAKPKPKSTPPAEESAKLESAKKRSFRSEK